VAWTLGANVENLILTGTGKVKATGNALDNSLTGNSAVNTLTGGAGNDVLDGGAGADTMIGNSGDDTYVVDNSSDKVTESANEGTDSVYSTVTYTLPATVEHLVLTGGGAINGTGNALSNLLRGGAGNNVLNGGSGNDVALASGGNDTLTDTVGSNALDGGDGTDKLTGGTGREFITGGAGNDTLTLGGGADIVAFSRGHGADAINAPTAASNGLNESNDTVSLGDVRYGELQLARSGNDLFLKVAGTGDSLKFTNWYAAAGNRTVITLQMIVDSTADYEAGAADPLADHRVAWFDFAALAGAFGDAYAANPAIGDWTVPTATFAAALRGSSDTQAFGGDFAYRHGRDGDLAALDFATAVALLGDSGFGVAPQTFSAVTAGDAAGLLANPFTPSLGLTDPDAPAASPEVDEATSDADSPAISAGFSVPSPDSGPDTLAGRFASSIGILADGWPEDPDLGNGTSSLDDAPASLDVAGEMAPPMLIGIHGGAVDAAFAL
jgi:hypothetical protein